ncbi:G-protein coupled receptor 157-like [Biomphalaria glabrata]|uniref:G-protein coupled receptor 157-like n=1 Tax=Biomphalaria glabrata TaxID=6526 RepID=A0A9W3ADB0_BIOGL|nr:G-protein coupled receptor 157-like [Biomphalaria glabrata]
MAVDGRLPINITFQSVDTAYVLISDFMSVLSCIGCMVIIILYVAYKNLRTTSRLLLVCLSVADIFVCISTVLQTETYYESIALPQQKSYRCQISASLLVFSQICAALWTVAVTFYLFLCVTCRYVTVANRIVFLFHIFCWGMPILVATSAEISGVYGYSTQDLYLYHHPTSCWISDRVANPTQWHLLTVEGWVMAAFVSVSIMYLFITGSVMKQKGRGRVLAGDDVVQELAIQTANEHLRFIPALYVATRLWGTAYFFFTRYQDSSHLRASDWLMIFKAIGDNSQGLVNAIYFCTSSRQVRLVVGKKLSTLCFCCSGWCKQQKLNAQDKWKGVNSIVRMRKGPKRPKQLDGSDLDLSGISLDLPTESTGGEDEVIFER